jgi:excisionase family DNA binding protein
MSDFNDNNELLSIPEAAKVLGCTPETVRNYVYGRRIKAQRLGGRYFLLYGDLKAFVRPKNGRPKKTTEHNK